MVTVSQACGSGGAGVRPLTRADWRVPVAGVSRLERRFGFVMARVSLEVNLLDFVLTFT